MVKAYCGKPWKSIQYEFTICKYVELVKKRIRKMVFEDLPLTFRHFLKYISICNCFLNNYENGTKKWVTKITKTYLN